MPKKVTIHDVARHAGVSHTTVSWALHNDPRITEETKKKVLSAVQALDYFPAFLGRSLVSGESKTIAVVGSTFSTSFEMELIHGIEHAMAGAESEYSMQLYSTLGDKNRKLRTFQKILQGRRADAVISVNMKPGPVFIEEFRDSGVSLVLVEDEFEGVSSVYCDSKAGTRLAVEHLLRQGCKRPGIIVASREDPEIGLSPVTRHNTYVQVLREHNIQVDPAWTIEIGEYYAESGLETLDKILQAGCDGIFCAGGDTVAIGFLKAARDAGVDVPGQIRIVGYDDINCSALVHPALTTIRQPVAEIGKTALNLALKGIKAEQNREWVAETMILQPELIVRESA